MELPLVDGPIVPGLPEDCGPVIDGPAGIDGLDKPMRRVDGPGVARIPLALVLGFQYLLGLDSSEDNIQNFRSGLPRFFSVVLLIKNIPSGNMNINLMSCDLIISTPSISKYKMF
jgi:hypothetical protein